MKNAILIFSFILSFGLAKSQTLAVGEFSDYPDEMLSYSLDATGDTMVTIHNYVCVIAADKPLSGREKVKWDKLKKDVKKAYPYAVMAKMKLAEMDAQLQLVKGEKARSDFSEKCEKELTALFANDMRNLTGSQGRILFKLLDRETGSTTYQIIKERRGSFSAFMWQGVAVVFGNNLKTDYDGNGADAKIEEVVVLIELGVI